MTTFVYDVYPGAKYSGTVPGRLVAHRALPSWASVYRGVQRALAMEPCGFAY